MNVLMDITNKELTENPQLYGTPSEDKNELLNTEETTHISQEETEKEESTEFNSKLLIVEEGESLSVVQETQAGQAARIAAARRRRREGTDSNTDIMVRFAEQSDEELAREAEKEHWTVIYGARQNQKEILKAELSGIENIQGQLFGIVYIGNIKGYLPYETSGYESKKAFDDAVGEEIVFKVVGINREEGIFTINRQIAIEHHQGLTWDQLVEGLNVYAKILLVNRRSLRVDIGSIPTTIGIDQISYEWIDDLTEHFKVGQDIVVKILKCNKETKALEVSHKAILKNPWPDCSRRFNEGGDYSGTVSGFEEYGVFVNLAPGVDCLCTHPNHQVGKVRKGDKVRVRISRVNIEKQQINGRIRRKR